MGIFYKAGYKYQLAKNYVIFLEQIPAHDIESEYVELTKGGRLTVSKGYAWDGPSGPAIDTKNFMRGSLVHDALYQLMREQKLDPRYWRVVADNLLRKLCREDGMSWIRAWWVYKSVRAFAKTATSVSNLKKLLTAPY